MSRKETGGMFEATGQLKLKMRRKQSGKTFIAEQYYALPLQVLPPYYQDEDGTAFVYLLNPTGGILQGDRLLTEVTVEEGARTLITTPSANKFYKMQDDHAELLNTFYVKEDAVLEYLPEYSIPYAKSRTYQESTFYLEESSVLFASDMVIPGRVDRGESFQYSLYDSKVKIYVDGRLEAYEYVRLSPDEKEVLGIGLLEGHTIYSSMFIYKKDLPESLREEICDILQELPEIYGAISYVTHDLAVVRMLADSVQKTQEATRHVWSAARKKLLSKDAVRIRRY